MGLSIGAELGHERLRFAEVRKLIDGEEPLRSSHTIRGYPKRIQLSHLRQHR
jgi:hypothetical protein